MDNKNKNDVLASLGDQATDGGGLKPAADQSLGDQATFLGEASSLEAVDDGLEVVDLTSRYKIERPLGQGGMGEVLLAIDTRLNRKVAIKRILGTASNNRTAVSRFLNEAQAVAALNHPNIVQIYDYGRAADGPFLIMEYVDGSSLLDRCRAGALPVEEAVELTCQICDGLSRAHEQGIIHRDIKPANVLLTSDGVPKLTDFGLAKVETVDTGMTMAGAVLGTLDFMPPEQRRNASSVDARSDLWSLAATLYQMVTGRVPTVIKLNDVPRSLQDFLSKALEDSQDDRYQTAKDFKAALKSSLFQSSASAIDSEGALGSGECPQCHVTNDPLRKFCNGCGTSLRVSCLECSTEMPVWEKFCGDCGASQEESLQTRLAALAAKSEEAEQQLADMNFEGARALAREIAGVADSRMQQLKPWADQFLIRVDSIFEDAINQAQVRLGESLTHEAAFDYRSGIKALANVPDVFRKEILPNAQASIETVLSRLKNKLKRTEELSRTILQRVQARQLTGLLADVQELSVLAPQRLDVVKLKDQLLQREPKLKQACQEALAEAEQQFHQQNYSGCLQFLSKVPSDFSLDEKVQELLERATTCNNRAKELRASIQASVSKPPTAGILLLIDEYLKIRPNDREVQDLRQRLAVQLRKKTEEEDAAKARLRTERLWFHSLIGSGVAVLVLMALSFLIFTIVSWNRAAIKENVERENLLQQPPLRNSIGIDLKLLPAGTFTMGEGGEAHQVTLTKPFYLGVYEVTQEQYERVMGNNPSEFKDPSNPVENVSWDEAVEFCKKLSEQPEEKAAGRVYRLPTEAEWEYACRAGSTTKYSFGDVEGQLGDYAWFSGNSNGKTHPVGQKQQNAWGLYDMHGNVWEWCSEWYGGYPKNVVTDPAEPNTDLASDGLFNRMKRSRERLELRMSGTRVRRGGSCRVIARGCVSCHRFGSLLPATSDIGFRVALSSSGTLQPRVGTEHDSTDSIESLPPREVVPRLQEPTLPASDNAVEETVPAKLGIEPYDSTASAPEAAADVSPTNTSLTNSIGMKLVQLPAGTFTMGEGNEAHQVTLTKPFYLGVYEVTQEQYERVMGNNPSQFKDPRNPVEQVSWHDSVEFCRKLSELPEEKGVGRIYRLPTEAEWEYACRAGSTAKYSFGDDEGQLGDYAWFSGNSNQMTHPVGQKKPNAWGLYDMHGNAWEWCADWYGDLPLGEVNDPTGPVMGSKRVNRGGSWDHVAVNCRSALHNGHDPFHRGRTGFRVAVSTYIETPAGATNNEGDTEVLFGGDFPNLGFDPRTATLKPFDLETLGGPTDNVEWRFRLAGKALRPLEQGNLKWRSLRYNRDHQPYVLDDVIDIGSLVLTLRTETGDRTQIQGKLHLIDSKGLKPFKKDLAVDLTVEVETRKQAVTLEYDQLKATRAKPGEGDKKNAELEKLASAMQACDRIQNVLAFTIEHNDEILESGLAFELVRHAAEGDVNLLRSDGPSKSETVRSSFSNSIGMRLTQLSAGTLAMGEGDEVQQITLTTPFFMGVHEVKQEQYERVMGNNPSQFKDPHNPVEQVSWHDAVEFCKKLSELPEEKAAGRVYRLPTEAEWEYACRAGSTTKYSFGDKDGQLGDYAWFEENSLRKPHHIGHKKPNAWGLYDMHGNVLEWCSEGSDELPNDLITIGPVQRSPNPSVRGGGWANVATGCRSAHLNSYSRDHTSSHVGFRVALSSSGLPESSETAD